MRLYTPDEIETGALEEELEAWHEAMVCMRFALAFGLLAFAAQILGFIAIFQNHDGKFLIMLLLAYVSFALSGHYKRTADDIIKPYK